MDRSRHQGSLTFRDATSNDHAAICSLLASEVLPTLDLSENALASFIVCEDGPAVVGVVGLELHGSSALLRSLAVTRQVRSQGIAAQLILRIESCARQLGVSRLFALTTTAQCYLEGKGFVLIERDQVPVEVRASTQFRELCPASAACLVKWIESTASNDEGET